LSKKLSCDRDIEKVKEPVNLPSFSCLRKLQQNGGARRSSNQSRVGSAKSSMSAGGGGQDCHGEVKGGLKE
jgi:hypothetical protein